MSNIARSLREREQAFEAHYQLDVEQNFRIRARRNRLFGEWVADKLGLDGVEAENYALKLAILDLDEAVDANVIHKIRHDLSKAEVKFDDLIIIERLGLCQMKAMEEMRLEESHDLKSGPLN